MVPKAPTNPVPSSSREDGSGTVAPLLPRTSKAPMVVVPLEFQAQPLPVPFWHPLVAYRSVPVAPVLFQFHASKVSEVRFVGPRTRKYDVPAARLTPVMPLMVTRPQH